MKWVNPYDQKQYEALCAESAIDFTDDPGMTLQAPAEEQDINIIMKKFGIKDGSRVPYWQDANAIYGDFSEMPTNPVEAAEYLRLGEVAFAALPATTRAPFRSGAELYNWLQNPDNGPEAVKLGLLVAPVSSSTSSDKEPLVQPPE